jgi:hypothetical protein
MGIYEKLTGPSGDFELTRVRTTPKESHCDNIFAKMVVALKHVVVVVQG